MFKNILLKLLLLGIVISIVVSEEKTKEKHEDHNEDEHDEEHESVTPKDHEKDEEHKDEEHKDEEHKDEEHHEDDDDEHHDEKKDDDHEEDEHHDENHDDDEGDHDEAKDDDDDDDDDEDSDDGGEHNPHGEEDAFLGDHLKDFKGISAEEAKNKLKDIIINEVDLNKDGFVTEDEIRARLHATTKQNRMRELNSTMMTHDDDKDGKVSWEEFKKHHYTDVDEDKEQMKDDEEKFKYADANGDGGLDLKEYMSFYYPGDDERMSAFMIAETLKKYDANKDGVLSKEEFFSSYKDINPDAKVELEKDFANTYDKNKDGKLEKDEISRWLFPDEDMPLEESPAMIKEADDDKDGKLSLDEILKNHKVFVDDPMAKDHDEL